MAIRNILQEGEQGLYKVCREQKDFNQRLATLLDDMVETMMQANGVGLAAPQVGILRRVVVVLDLSESEEGEVIEMVNPQILETEGEQEGTEGCLSFPGQYGVVTRPMRVKVRAQDRNGSVFERWGEGLTARAFCHEIDHLDGHVFKELCDHILSEEELDALYAVDEEYDEDFDEDYDEDNGEDQPE